MLKRKVKHLRHLLARLSSFVLLTAIIPFAGPCCAQVAVRIDRNPNFGALERFRRIVSVGKQVWLITSDGAYRVTGNTANRVPDEDLSVRTIADINGQVWVGTNRGAYRVVGDIAEQVLLEDVAIREILEVNGQFWLMTDNGAYRIRGDTVRRMPDRDLEIRAAIIVDSRLWLATNRGAYRVSGDNVQRIPDEDLSVRAIYHFNQQTWLATDTGAYRITADAGERIANRPFPVSEIRHDDGHVWLLSGERPEFDVYEVLGNNIQRIPNVDALVDVFENFNGQTWIGTDKGTYRLNPGTTKQILNEHVPLRVVRSINGRTWLGTDKGAYRVIGDSVETILDESFRVQDIRDINGQVWLATSDGGFVVTGDTLKRIPDEDVMVWSIEFVNGHIWLPTPKGTYLVEGDTARRIPEEEGHLTAQPNVSYINGRVWLEMNDQAYRVDEGVAISVVPVGADSWWKTFWQKILGDVWISGTFKPQVGYVRYTDKKDPYGEDFPRQFEIIWDTDKDSFEAAVRNNRYNAAERSLLPLEPGKRTIYVSVRDRWHNTFRREISGWVLPTPVVLVVVVPILWVGILPLVILLAPATHLSHNLLMSRALRTYGSLFLVPLVLTTFSVARRHVLRRYLRGIRTEEDFSQWKDRFVVPSQDFLPESFGRKLEEHRALFLSGQSGVGKTSFLQFLTYFCALPHRKQLAPKNAIPVYLPLIRQQSQEPDRMFHAALSSYGQFTDEELTASFLRQGGFIILIDGLNEVTDEVKNKIHAFVNEHNKKNFFCVSSQECNPDFAWIDEINMLGLAPEKVKEFLRKRVDPGKAEAVIEKLDNETCEIYRIPQDLEFGVELLRQDKQLPRSRRELYEEVLAPILDSWRTSGRGDYELLLFRRAYSMLSSHGPFFDEDNDSLPEDIRNPLLERKLLVRRGDRFLFQHDLVRAYLASMYFRPRWRQVLSDKDLALDSNWRPMLEFALLEIGTPDEAKELMLVLLKKNKQLAGILFSLVCKFRPDLSMAWRDNFLLAFGQASLPA